MGKVDIRSCIIAPPGKVLLCADYAGQELRILAHVCNEPTMIQAFLDDMDVHLAIANRFGSLGIPDEYLITTHSEHEATKSKFKTERNNAKVVNFGIAYGKSKYGFAADWNWPVNKAEKFINDYFAQFPRIKETIDKCNKLIEQQKAIRNLMGRIRRFDYVDNRAKRQAFNFCIQGAAADIGKLAGGRVRKLCLDNPQWGCNLVLSVHDEYVWEINEDQVKLAMPIIRNTIESSVQLRVPMIVDMDYGPNYSESKP